MKKDVISHAEPNGRANKTHSSQAHPSGSPRPVQAEHLREVQVSRPPASRIKQKLTGQRDRTCEERIGVSGRVGVRSTRKCALELPLATRPTRVGLARVSSRSSPKFLCGQDRLRYRRSLARLLSPPLCRAERHVDVGSSRRTGVCRPVPIILRKKLPRAAGKRLDGTVELRRCRVGVGGEGEG